MKRGQTKRNRAFRVDLKAYPPVFTDKQLKAYLEKIKPYELKGKPVLSKMGLSMMQQLVQSRENYVPMTWEEVAAKGREIAKEMSKRKR